MGDRPTENVHQMVSVPLRLLPAGHVTESFFFFRLNNKLKARNVIIEDLVKDISDGVC